MTPQEKWTPKLACIGDMIRFVCIVLAYPIQKSTNQVTNSNGEFTRARCFPHMVTSSWRALRAFGRRPNIPTGRSFSQ